MGLRIKAHGRDAAGEVAEWSKANDSKSFEGQPSVGSNPTLSVFTGSKEAQRARQEPLVAATATTGLTASPRPGSAIPQGCGCLPASTEITPSSPGLLGSWRCSTTPPCCCALKLLPSRRLPRRTTAPDAGPLPRLPQPPGLDGPLRPDRLQRSDGRRRRSCSLAWRSGIRRAGSLMVTAG